MASKSTLMGVAFVAVLGLALVLSGYGAALAVGGGGGSTSTTTVVSTATNSTGSSPYVVTLVIATNSIFNSSVGDQPAFFLLGPHGLESSAKISVPANRLIKLVIVNYDDGNASLNIPVDNRVSGTSDGTIFVASNDNINSSQGASGIVVKGGQSVASVPATDVAHTFTMPSLGLNVPVPVSSTVVAYITLPKAGTFNWYCETACGDAAMAAAGWMAGTLVAS